MPTSTEVLKRNAPVSEVREPIVLRRLDVAHPDNPPELGCPMLTRSKIELPTAGGQTVPRCALAWAIHSEHEAMLCMLTPDLLDCWKAHPENREALEAKLAQDTAAD